MTIKNTPPVKMGSHDFTYNLPATGLTKERVDGEEEGPSPCARGNICRSASNPPKTFHWLPAQKAELVGLTILIEPLNNRDAPSYHLQSVEASAKVISAINSDRIKIMFDFYHIQILQGDVLNRFKAHLPFIGHVQIASVPERTEPDRGELNYVNLISAIYEAGYQGYVGAEYKPITDTDSGLGWLASY